MGRNKCSGCIFSTDLDDPLFVGIGKVVASIVSKQYNNNLNYISNVNNDLISYPCTVMNFFQCPFESNNNQYPYTKEHLFALQRLAFTIEQAISIFHETTKNNEIIYEVDFENDRVQEIHTNYNGEPYNEGWNDLNVKEQLSKVKPISSTIKIINEQEIYNILTNRETLEFILQEYYKEQQYKHELEEEQQILLSEDKRHNIIDFILNNKDSIRVEDLNISEPFYKCYREKANCSICNSLSNIICTNCNNHEEIWLCTNHWQQHKKEKHE